MGRRGREDPGRSGPKKIRRAGYESGAEGIFRIQRKRDEETRVQLTNFAALIFEQTIEDDGQSTQPYFWIEAWLHGVVRRFRVAATEFDALGWVARELGAEAIVFPEFGSRQHLAAAIRHLSDKIATRRVYRHLGWRRRKKGKSIYLTAGGAIGAVGAVESAEVEVPASLKEFRLPNPPTGEELGRAVRNALHFLDAAEDGVSVPLFGAVFRAPLGPIDSSLVLVGATGTGKTSIAVVAQQFFGAGLDGGNIPASWSSTANYLEDLLFLSKDTLTLVDDYVPPATMSDSQRQQRDAERLLRSQGNRSGRGRMSRDGSLRAGRPPRSLILSTGEDLPAGQSLRARMFVVQVRETSIRWEKLTLCQGEAEEGGYASVMSAYVRWIAPQLREFQEISRERVKKLRATLNVGEAHKRTLANVAELLVGIEFFVDFARKHGAMTKLEARELRLRCRESLLEVARSQRGDQDSSDQALRFLDILGSAVSSGQAHFVSAKDGQLPNAARWGWAERGDVLLPQGLRIGWIDGDDLYVDPVAALQVVQRVGHDQGTPITSSAETLLRRLHDHGLLSSIEVRKDGNRFLVRRMIGGVRVRVMHLKAETLGRSSHTKLQDGNGAGPTAPDEEPPEDQMMAVTRS